MSKTPDSAVRTYIGSHYAAFVDGLVTWLRIVLVSARPEHAADVRRSADWRTAKLGEAGFATAEVWPTAEASAVFAEWSADDPQARTVLVHGHHDVPPAAREDGWDSDPFETETREGRRYARRAADRRRNGRTCGTTCRRTGVLRTDEHPRRNGCLRGPRGAAHWKGCTAVPRPPDPVPARFTSR